MRAIVTGLSVAIPLLTCGTLLARYSTSILERFILLVGLFLLIVSAGVSIAALPNADNLQLGLAQSVGKTSNLLGISSLVLYLFVVLITIIRTGENIGELGERFAYLADHMSEGFLLRSHDGPITMVNKQFFDMFQLRESDVVGQNWKIIVEQLQLNSDESALTIPEHEEYRAKGLQSE